MSREVFERLPLRLEYGLRSLPQGLSIFGQWCAHSLINLICAYVINPTITSITTAAADA